MTKARALREQLKRYKKSAKHFTVKAALAAENTPESRKQSRAMNDQHYNRFTSPGLYWQPKGAISARG